jgi:hypothetical protein
MNSPMDEWSTRRLSQHCGCEVEGVEPDARKYECEACGEKTVYGAEELLLLTAG